MFSKDSNTRKNRFRYLTLLRGAFGMLRNPDHTDSVFDIEDGLRYAEATTLAIEHLRSDADVARMIDERHLAPPPDMKRLLTLPGDSLGYCFSHQLVDQGFTPDYYRKIDVKDDIDYVLMRMRQTHDIWHVVTGIPNDRIGEIGVKAFELAQTRRPMAAVIAAGGVFRYMAKDPEQFAEVLDTISKSYRTGAAAKPFLAQKWEHHWEKPVDVWRDELNVTVAPPTLRTQTQHSNDEGGPWQAKSSERIASSGLSI